MFAFMLGWRKASKCKKLMKKLRCRLNLLKNKRCCIVRQLRNDVAQLIKHGHHQTAFNRVDQIYKDECIIGAYDLLAHFCEFLSLQLAYIRRSKDCPNDINEAISSLIFASARCGELPELIRIRKLFSERYGACFEATALGLLPGNLVNFQIREKLCINKVPNQIKFRLIEEITKTVLQTGPLALEYTSEQAANDVEEFQTPLKDGENEKDQRVFLFKSSPGAGNHKGINLLITIMEKLRKRSVSSEIECSHRPEESGAKNSERPGVCSRAMTMPCNHWKKCADEDGVMIRCHSFPVQGSWPHVHPKLPDYDELAATFMALKKEKIQDQET